MCAETVVPHSVVIVATENETYMKLIKKKYIKINLLMTVMPHNDKKRH